MARPKAPAKPQATLASSASIYRPKTGVRPDTDRNQIAQAWQVEAYRHVNICGEARFAVTVFAAKAARAQLGISEPHTLDNKAVWINEGAEVDALAELAPTVRERAKLIRDFMTHYVIAGECYLIARKRVRTDPEFEDRKNEPLWEIVAVTELRKTGDVWSVRHDNNEFIELAANEPVIRMWNPDPENRREAWSPFRSLLPILREIEWLTKYTFTQVRSRLMSSGVWFLPDNLTFPKPPDTALDGGAEAIALLNEAEQFMLSLAASSMEMLDENEVSFPSIVMASPEAIATVDKEKLIQFWSALDDKTIILRDNALRRFALGMDLPPEQILGSTGHVGNGAGGSQGSGMNHWGEWANEEKTISTHIEPALDLFVATLTSGYLRSAVEGTELVVGYDTATLRLRPDRSKESIELYQMGALKADRMLTENGFDPASDKMDDKEFKRWLVSNIAKGAGAAVPEQIQAALKELGVDLELEALPNSSDAPGVASDTQRSIADHPYEGPPREQHDHTPAPYSSSGYNSTGYSSTEAAAEVLVLRALEKYGNRILNDGKRGRDKDRTTPVHLAHVAFHPETPVSGNDFDFSLAPTVFGDRSAAEQARLVAGLGRYCAHLVNTGQPYTRETMLTYPMGE